MSPTTGTSEIEVETMEEVETAKKYFDRLIRQITDGHLPDIIEGLNDLNDRQLNGIAGAIKQERVDRYTGSSIYVSFCPYCGAVLIDKIPYRLAEADIIANEDITACWKCKKRSFFGKSPLNKKEPKLEKLNEASAAYDYYL